MSLDKARISRRFGRAVATYDRHADVQRLMADRLAEALAAAGPRPASILELGCGTGYLTELLCARFPGARVTAVDLSPPMVEAARARLDGAAEVLLGDAEERPWGGRTFDAVVSSATLQWLAEPSRTMRLVAGSLRPGGTTLHATFGPRTFEELHRVFGEVERERGLEGRMHGLELRGGPEWEGLLRAAGLASVRSESRIVEVAYADCRAFLASVKGTGSRSGQANGAGPVTRDAMLEVLRRYDASARAPGGGVVATYELVELSARREA